MRLYVYSFEALGILSVVCTFGGSEGVTQTVMGLHHLARARNEKPFAVLVDALQSDASVFTYSSSNFISFRILKCQLQCWLW